MTYFHPAPSTQRSRRGLFATVVFAAGCIQEEPSIVPDPPTDGLLVLDLKLEHPASGVFSGARKLRVFIDEVEVKHRRLVNGQLQAPEYFTVATGPVPVWFYAVTADFQRFAGQYWLPPGEVQDVRVGVSAGLAEAPGGNFPILFGPTVQAAASSGVVRFVPQGGLPVITPGGRTGLELVLDTEAESDVDVGASAVAVDTELDARLVAQPARFEFHERRLLVRFDPEATAAEVQAWELTTGAREVMSRQTGLRVLEFTGTDWGGILAKLVQYRASPLVAYATLDPLLRPAGHDPTLHDDQWYADDEAAYLADIGVEDAWDLYAAEGSREVIVGFVDTGIDYNHPDLVNNLWVNEGELPDIGTSSFVDVFDLDSDGVFTLNDLNHPSSASALASALADLQSATGITLDASLYDEASVPFDDGLYQGGDLLEAFVDGADDDGNGVVDDIIGARVTLRTTENKDTGLCEIDEGATDLDNDPYPVDGASHGTQTAGLVAMEWDNASNGAGVMEGVRILEARLTNEGECGAYDLAAYLAAIDYLYQNGANVIVMEFAGAYEVSETEEEAMVEKITSEFESFPDVLFVTPAGNRGLDCDDAGVYCLPADNQATNTINVMATGIDYTAATGVMTGRWNDTAYTGTAEHASSHGTGSMELGAPGYLYKDFDATTGTDLPLAGMPSIGTANSSNAFAKWNPDLRDWTGATSAAVAVVGGVAGLVYARCPSSMATGADLADALLNGANTSPAEDISAAVDGGRYLDAVGAILECP